MQMKMSLLIANLASILAMQSVHAGPISSGGGPGGPTCGGGSPFSASGDLLNAIFHHQEVWRKVTGPLQRIEVLSAQSGRSQIKVVTTEYIPIIDSNGTTTGYRPTTCSFIAEVHFENCAPKVLNVDFSQCPIHKNLAGEPGTCPPSHPASCGS